MGAVSTAAPFPGRYSQHQRELLVAGYLDCTLEQLRAGADRWIEDSQAGARGVSAVPGVESLLSLTIEALSGIAVDRSQAEPGSPLGDWYVQAIASTCDASLHVALELVLGRDPLALPSSDPRIEGL
jgi:hypothetical protein